MAALDNLSDQFQPITASEARGDSRPVSQARYNRLAAKGQQMIASAARKPSTAGLDRDWHGLKERAYDASQSSWGGMTVNSRTGRTISQGARAYAVTAKQPNQGTVRIPENASREEFHAAMDKARDVFGQLGHQGMHLGVFHDDEQGSIDIDPVRVVKRKADVHKIGAATHAIGGAYAFRTGNGNWPPHVRGK